ncbi:MAG TPA: hypothetical protein VEG60_27490 [Candidatus Binatia bacterium]|nr:hypothetical protein [Candidatus Binatia bacterium]
MWLLVLSALVGLMTSQAIAQEKKPGGRPGAVMAEGVSITATVEAIDYDKRTVDLKGPKGKVVTLKVGPEAKNFNQVKTGDRVRARYFESTAIAVRKAGEPPFAEETKTVQRAAPGGKPGAVAVDTIEMTARVEDIDYKARTVTLRGPQQKTMTLKVDKGVKRFNEVKKGDEIVIRHTEALAIDVNPAK